MNNDTERIMLQRENHILHRNLKDIRKLMNLSGDLAQNIKENLNGEIMYVNDVAQDNKELYNTAIQSLMSILTHLNEDSRLDIFINNHKEIREDQLIMLLQFYVKKQPLSDLYKEFEKEYQLNLTPECPYEQDEEDIE